MIIMDVDLTLEHIEHIKNIKERDIALDCLGEAVEHKLKHMPLPKWMKVSVHVWYTEVEREFPIRSEPGEPSIPDDAPENVLSDIVLAIGNEVVNIINNDDGWVNRSNLIVAQHTDDAELISV